jgi:hypothetical protein
VATPAPFGQAGAGGWAPALCQALPHHDRRDVVSDEPSGATTRRPARLTRGPSRLRAILVWTVVLSALWLGLVGQVDLFEVVVAVGVALAAATAGVVVRERAGFRHRPDRAWWRHGPGMFLSALRDCLTLLAALGRRLGGEDVEGRTLALPCEVGGEDAAATARRVLVTLGTSLQPNSYVLGFDEGRQLVVVRQLVATDDPPVAADLRGRP